jgi:predicted N-acetyltransferase YhbS
MHKITLEKPQDAVAIEKLLNISFGEERFKKTAYALRQNSNPIPELCCVVRDDEMLLASIQYWHLRIAEQTPALLLGPIVVQPERQGEGIGIGLIRDTLSIAKSMGHKIVILVGDPDYYQRFGFTSALAKGLELPGPVEAHRFLVCELQEGALRGVKGMVNGHKMLADSHVS